MTYQSFEDQTGLAAHHLESLGRGERALKVQLELQFALRIVVFELQ